VDDSNIFGDQGILALNSAKAAVSCKQAPKWYKRPHTVAFAFGGKVVTISNPSPPNLAQQAPTDNPSTKLSPVVNIKQVVTESTLVERALKLENASQARNLQNLCEERVNQLPSTASTIELQNWKLLLTRFKTDSSNELVNLLGFSRSKVKSMVERQIEN
jgi:protein transport protein SEC31